MEGNGMELISTTSNSTQFLHWQHRISVSQFFLCGAHVFRVCGEFISCSRLNPFKFYSMCMAVEVSDIKKKMRENFVLYSCNTFMEVTSSLTKDVTVQASWYNYIFSLNVNEGGVLHRYLFIILIMDIILCTLLNGVRHNTQLSINHS